MTQPALYTLAFALYAGGMALGLSVGWLARGKKERGRWLRKKNKVRR